MAKYRFTGETKQVLGSDGNPVTVKQICATDSFGKFMQVKVGDLGGWIQSENTLPQEGNSWVFPDAVVCESALLGDDSIVYGNAMVRGDAILFRNARVGGYALVEGKTLISGEAQIQGNAHIFENATVKGKAVVEADAIVKGSAKIYGSAVIRDGAEVSSDMEWITIGPIGPDDCSLTFYRNKENKLSVGSSNQERAMTLKEFTDWVKRMHSLDSYTDEYREAINLAKYRTGIPDKEAARILTALYNEYEKANGSVYYSLNPIGRAPSRPEVELKGLIRDLKDRSEGNVITCKVSPEMKALMQEGIDYLEITEEELNPESNRRFKIEGGWQ